MGKPFPGLWSLDLSEAVLAAEGHMRLVYEHPAYPGMLIKLIRPEVIGRDGKLGGHYAARSNKFKEMRRIGAFLTLQRELTEFLALRARSNASPLGDWPIQRIFGFAETGKGMGLIVEKLVDDRGRLAPTLHDLVVSGRFRPEHRAALDRFFGRLADLHVCVGNMHTKNIVYAGGPSSGRFVGVDGLGDKAAIPLADWSAWYNRLRIRSVARKIYAAIDRAGVERAGAGRHPAAAGHQQKNAGTGAVYGRGC